MFISIEEFITEWKHEAENTEKLLSVLTDDSLDQSIGEDLKSLGELTWHVTSSIKEIISHTGLQFEGPSEKDELPGTAKEILEAYSKVSNALVEAVQSKWNDDSLKEIINAFGFEMPIFALLRMTIQHQTHHRGQMTVLMRQAGLVIPGMYGPSKEEWANISF